METWYYIAIIILLIAILLRLPEQKLTKEQKARQKKISKIILWIAGIIIAFGIISFLYIIFLM